MLSYFKNLIPCFIFLFVNIQILSAATFEVGPGKLYTAPSQVSGLVTNGDTVAIDAGEYLGDVATWSADNLVLIGIGGKAHLRANGNNAQGKAIWVIQGDNTTVINIEFSECMVPDENGAGIRQEGMHLSVRNCYFHHNENGILAGDNAGSNILVENSVFAYNGFGQGFTHNIYINKVASFTLRYCYMHHANVGHNVKSRAIQSYILYNRIMDEDTGNASMLLDLSNGGISMVVGNLFHQGANAINKRLITYGLEGLSNPTNELYVINNTFINNRFNGEFVVVQTGATSQIQNNVFAGPGTVLIGPGTQTTNVNVLDPASLNLNDFGNYNYNLTENSIALINLGSDPGLTNGNLPLGPEYSYLHPITFSPRLIIDAIDIGAYELSNECADLINYWIGEVDSDWTKGDNWSCGVPTLQQTVVIPGNTPICILSGGKSGECYEVQVRTGGVLRVEDNAVLEVEK